MELEYLALSVIGLLWRKRQYLFFHLYNTVNGIYQDAARYDSSHIFRSLPPAMVPTEVGEMDLPENLFTIVTETYELRQLRKISRKNAFRPTITPSSSPPSISLAEYPSFASISHLVPDLSRTTSCQRCVDLSTDQHCIQSYPVDEFPNYKEYDGAVLTFAPPNDYLDPKVSFSVLLNIFQ